MVSETPLPLSKQEDKAQSQPKATPVSVVKAEDKKVEEKIVKKVEEKKIEKVAIPSIFAAGAKK